MTKQSESRETHSVDRDNEPVSALVDGELDPKGAAFLIRRLSDDPHMHERWQRFHLVRACLQREFSGPVSLVARVRHALENEAAPRRSGRFASLLRVGTGGAVAAGVAIVAVLGLANRMESGNSGMPEPVQEPGFVSHSTALDRQFNAPLVPAGFGTNQSSASGIRAASEAQQRINRYMIRHSQAVGGNELISYTPVLAAPAAVHRLADDAAGNRADDADQVEDGNR